MLEASMYFQIECLKQRLVEYLSKHFHHSVYFKFLDIATKYGLGSLFLVTYSNFVNNVVIKTRKTLYMVLKFVTNFIIKILNRILPIQNVFLQID